MATQKKGVIYYLEQIYNALTSATAPAIVGSMTVISGDILEHLNAGDKIIKRDSTGDHAYTVSYKGAGGLCLTYADCENVETVAYNRSSAGEWTYDSTDVTHIAS